MSTISSMSVSSGIRRAAFTAAPTSVTPQVLSGAVVYIYAFDIAYDMKRLAVPTLLGCPVTQFEVDASRHSPRQLSFYRPQMVRLPCLEKLGPGGQLRAERTVKILPVGAISITVRVPFDVANLQQLLPFHDLRFADGKYLYDHVFELAEQVRCELQPYAVRPAAQLAGEEAYTAFFLNAPMRNAAGAAISGEQFFREQRPQIAALLTEEADGARLSNQEIEESTGKYLSYYQHDLVVVDWDAALVIDEPRYFNETLHMMELANMQLTELEAYDRILDGVVDRSYRDLSRSGLRPGGHGRFETDLREIRIDLARLNDELSNITKFFGDWHLARVYHHLSARFHLNDWRRNVDEKLRTLDELYQLLEHGRNSRWLLVLEFTMTLLFVIDLILLIVLGVK